MPAEYGGVPGTWPTSLTPAMIARQPALSSPQLSLDGSTVAYLSMLDGRTDLMTLDNNGHPRQITSDHSIGRNSFAWSPDSSEIAFTSGEDGKLWICSKDGRNLRRVTRLEGTQHTPRFSPDGRYLAFLQLSAESVELMVVSADGHRVRQISRGSDIPMAPNWSPDGTRLVWHQYPFDLMPWDQSSLMVSNVFSDENPRELAHGDRVAYAQASFSPDSQRIVCVCDRGGWLNVTEMRSDGSDRQVLHADHWEHGEPAYAPDGNWIAYTRNVDGNYSLWVVPSGGGTPRQLTDMSGHVTNPCWTPDGRRVMFLFDSPITPSDIFNVDVQTGNLERLTRSTIGGIEPDDLVVPESLTWYSADGFEVHGHLFVPRHVRSGQHGCLVNIHGGPMNQSRLSWNGQIQYLAQRGWVVIQPNYRGSIGYGRAYREALFGSWGEGDLLDNLGAVDACVARDLIRRDRVVAWGGSAGGYSTFVCMTKAPDVFAGGIALYGLADLYPFGLETHRFERYYVQTILGQSVEHFPLWWERSPINHVDRVRAPMLILQGDVDPVVSHAQSDTFVRELERRNMDFEYVVYAGEGHGFRQVRHLIDATERIDRFLRQKVLHDPEPRGASVMPYRPMPKPGRADP